MRWFGFGCICRLGIGRGRRRLWCRARNIGRTIVGGIVVAVDDDVDAVDWVYDDEGGYWWWRQQMWM